MTDNPALQRSLNVLSQPYTWAALALLFFNDHILRHVAPSWWTGKLGDLAWLFVAPLLLALLLSLCIPSRWKKQELVVSILAFGLTALFFTGLKALPLFRDGVLATLKAGLGFPAAVLIDPGDLITLLALLICCGLWWKAKPVFKHSLLRVAWVLPIFALLTLADAARPDEGITCLRLQKAQVLASAGYSSYLSQDGGLTWQLDSNYNEGCRNDNSLNQTEVTTLNKSISYGIDPSGDIVLSKDNGATWQFLVGYRKMDALDQYYYSITHNGSPYFSKVPADILLDPQSGNVIFAMGHAGVLVVKTDGSLVQSAVASYQPVDYSRADVFFTMLGNELWMALSLLFLLVSLWFAPWRRWISWIILILFFLAWLILLLLAQATGYIGLAFLIALPFLDLFNFGLALENIIFSIRKKKGSWWQSLLYALIGILVFIAPFVLWYLRLLPEYEPALIISMIWVVLFAGCGIWQSLRVKTHKQI